MIGWKPEGYPSLSPYLVTTGAERVIEFLRQAFGATELRRYDDPAGGIMHAELRLFDSVLMLADGTDAWPPFPSFVHLYVPDVDESYQRAIRAGGSPVQEPQQREGDPDRRGGVADPSGNTWWIATQRS